MRTNILIIHNPTSGRSAAATLDAVRARLRLRGCNVEIFTTTKPGDARTRAGQVRADETDIVAVAGGDGTINEVVNGLGADADASAVPLGIIPLGTANVLALELDLPKTPHALADVIVDGPLAKTYPGRVGGPGGRLFVMMAGAGVDSRIVRGVSPRLKRMFGKGAYGVAGLREWVFLHKDQVEVEINGAVHRASSVIVAKGSRFAGPFVIAPDARLAEPQFWVCLINWQGRWGVLRIALGLLLGTFSGMVGVNIIKTPALCIRGPKGLALQLDGDDMGNVPVTMDIAENPVYMATGRRA